MSHFIWQIRQGSSCDRLEKRSTSLIRLHLQLEDWKSKANKFVYFFFYKKIERSCGRNKLSLFSANRERGNGRRFDLEFVIQWQFAPKASKTKWNFFPLGIEEERLTCSFPPPFSLSFPSLFYIFTFSQSSLAFHMRVENVPNFYPYPFSWSHLPFHSSQFPK